MHVVIINGEGSDITPLAVSDGTGLELDVESGAVSEGADVSILSFDDAVEKEALMKYATYIVVMGEFFNPLPFDVDVSMQADSDQELFDEIATLYNAEAVTDEEQDAGS
jgi:hypothetical protein